MSGGEEPTCPDTDGRPNACKNAITKSYNRYDRPLEFQVFLKRMHLTVLYDPATTKIDLRSWHLCLPLPPPTGPK